MKKHLSTTDIIIIGVTFTLFLIALFVKGLTKDMLLEAGVLLVSVKLIMMNYKTNIKTEKTLEELAEIKGKLSNSKINLTEKS